MFSYCPMSKNVSKICEFAVHRDGIIYCGIATKECDSDGESIVKDMRCCPLEKIKAKKQRQRRKSWT